MRAFNGSSQYLSYGGLPGISAFPFTMACWGYYSSDAADRRTLMAIDNTGSTAANICLQVAMDVAGNPVAIFHGTSLQNNATAGPTSANALFHACGVWVSATERYVYFNGGSKGGGTGLTSGTFGTYNRIQIGRRRFSGSDGRFWPGGIGFAAVWDAALNDSEVAALAKGFHPRLVRPGSLQASWNLWGNSDPEVDNVGGFVMTNASTTKSTLQPPMIMRKGQGRIFVPEAVVGGAVVTRSRTMAGVRAGSRLAA